MKQIVSALSCVIAIATCQSGAFAQGAFEQGAFEQDAFANDAERGAVSWYDPTSWQTSCRGEPLQLGRCLSSDRYVRCWRTVNPLVHKVTCDHSMQATMYNVEENIKRAYTASLQTVLFATDSDWLCFNFSELIDATWTLEDVFEPVVVCKVDDPPEPPERPECEEMHWGRPRTICE